MKSYSLKSTKKRKNGYRIPKELQTERVLYERKVKWRPFNQAKRLDRKRVKQR